LKAPDVFNQFLKLDELERNAFFATLSLWTDIPLPGGTFMVITKDQYRRATQAVMITEIAELYEAAKQVCHSFGVPYRHPVTGEVTPPPKPKKRKKG
jgi:hypothetical protein